MTIPVNYPVGIPGVAWGPDEVSQWQSQQTRQRSYVTDVLSRVELLRARFDVVRYGCLDYAPDSYPLFAIKSRNWNDKWPCVLVTGGVHGYETSGVHGALQFVEKRAHEYEEKINLLIAPCVSPWAYERIHRWNMHAIDPNRSFCTDSQAAESAALMAWVAPFSDRVRLHIDLHETTDSDESEFRPALAARDGVVYEPGEIPDGFYLVGDSENPQPAFQQAIIESVARVMPIAPTDAYSQIIGTPVTAHGVINYPCQALGLCASITEATYKTTTEVYPGNSQAISEQCNAAQVAAVCAAIDFALVHGA